jgi:hypothetical protein
MLIELIALIINTRDFCGNEREAAEDFFADLGKPFDESLYAKARFKANNEWRNCQKAAGVAPKYQLW